MPSENPYAAPVSDLGTGTRPAPPGRRGRVLWAVEFAASLIVPGLFASTVLSPPGWAGMGVAVLLLLTMGLIILTIRPGWHWSANTGAFLVAATQFLPILQMVVGGVAVSLACAATGFQSPMVDEDFPTAHPLGLGTASLATLLGGLTLMGFSLIVGLIVEAIWVRPRSQARLVPVEEVR